MRFIEFITSQAKIKQQRRREENECMYEWMKERKKGRNEREQKSSVGVVNAVNVIKTIAIDVDANFRT